jgi:hypothetical protein
MARGSGRERKRREQREPGDDASTDDREAKPLSTARKWLARERESGSRKHGRDDCPTRADEERREAGDRDLRERHRERECEHSEQPPTEPGARR